MSHPKTFLITGCSSGIGRALVEAALAQGHRVIATARDISSLHYCQAEPRCKTLPLDVTDYSQLQQTLEQAQKAWGSIDVLINNAGRGLVAAVEECSDADSRANMEVNFFAPLAIIRSILPIMRQQGSGIIVNISAAAAIANYPGFGIYGAAKAAMEYMSESLRAEVSPLGLQVMLVQPGPFRTDFIARSMQPRPQCLPEYQPTAGKFSQLIQSMHGRQPGDPAKAAQAILTAALSPSPPLRLVLGRYANTKARRRYADLETERNAMEPIGLQTDY